MPKSTKNLTVTDVRTDQIIQSFALKLIKVITHKNYLKHRLKEILGTHFINQTLFLKLKAHFTA